MKKRRVPSGIAALLLACLTAGIAAAQGDLQATEGTVEGIHEDEKPPYSPYVDEAIPTKVYWGDTHLHTVFSFDAGSFGVRLDPNDAFAFARGEQRTSATGQPVKLGRPLDFLVVTDHSDNMGWFQDFYAGDPDILAVPQGKEWYDAIQAGGEAATDATLDMINQFGAGTFPSELMYSPDSVEFRDAWEKTIAAAEAYNDPGNFTAFIGYEWTSLGPPGKNLHRNVIYRDNAFKAIQTVPYTTYPPGSIEPEDLWDAMQAYEDATGGRLLAIPHNGNLSSGWMFPEEDCNPASIDENGVCQKGLTRKYAKDRAKWEPLYEVVQMKGAGETHPLLSPNDEFADFGIWDQGNLDLTEVKCRGECEGEYDPDDPSDCWQKCIDILTREYARSALLLGMEIEQDPEFGTNPYKFGMVGSTDSHTALSTTEEDNYYGKHSGGYEPSPHRWNHPMMESPGDENDVGSAHSPPSACRSSCPPRWWTAPCGCRSSRPCRTCRGSSRAWPQASGHPEAPGGRTPV